MYQVIVNELKDGSEATEIYRQKFPEVNLAKLIALLNKKPRIRKSKRHQEEVVA